MNRSLLLVFTVIAFIVTMQLSCSAQDTTGGSAPNGKDKAGSLLPAGTLTDTLSNLDKALTAGLLGTMAGLTLAATGLLLTLKSSVEGRIQQLQTSAVQVGDKQISARIGRKVNSLEGQSEEASAAVRFSLRAFAWFLSGLFIALVFDPIVASKANNLSSKLWAATDVAATGAPMILGIINLGRSAVMLSEVAEHSLSGGIDAANEHEELDERENAEHSVEGESERQQAEAYPTERRRSTGQSVARPEHPGRVMRFFRTLLRV